MGGLHLASDAVIPLLSRFADQLTIPHELVPVQAATLVYCHIKSHSSHFGTGQYRFLGSAENSLRVQCSVASHVFTTVRPPTGIVAIGLLLARGRVKLHV
jgi:hypothetical protein